MPKFIRYATVAAGLLAATACTRQETEAGDTAARKAGRAAYKVAEESKGAAQKAGKALQKAGREAQAGWKEAKKDAKTTEGRK